VSRNEPDPNSSVNQRYRTAGVKDENSERRPRLSAPKNGGEQSRRSVLKRPNGDPPSLILWGTDEED